MTVRKPPLYIAVHEAGHAVGHWVSGLPFERVFLRPDECDDPGDGSLVREIPFVAMVVGGRKFDRFSADPADLGEDEERDARLLRDAMADILCDVAGPVADAKHRKLSLKRVFNGGGGGTDYNNAEDTASFFEETHEPEFLIGHCVGTARRIFRERTIWQATLALGKFLQDQREMTYSEVLEFLHKATGFTQDSPILTELMAPP